MENSTLCQHCYTWRCHPEDRFCGYCGEHLLQAQVTISKKIIYQGEPIPDQIDITIRNIRGGLGGTSFKWQNQAGNTVHIDGLKELGKNDFNEPNEQRSYSTKSSEFNFKSNVPIIWELIHQITTERAYSCASLAGGFPKPHLALELSEITLQNTTEPQPLTLILQHVKGGPAYIENIELSAYEGAALNLPQIEATFPLTLDETNKQQSLTLPITENLWQVLQGRPQGLELSLEVKIQDSSSPIELPLKLRVPFPAQPRLQLPKQSEPIQSGQSLRFSRSADVRALQDHALRLPLQLENQGGDSCLWRNVQVTIRTGPNVIYTHDTPSFVPGKLLPAGATEIITFEIPLHEAEPALTAKRYQCDVQLILDNEEKLDHPKLNLELEICPAKEYTGTVAIDFGTTATAVAYYLPDNQGNSPIPLPLSAHEEKFIPTAIAYYLDEDHQLHYKIGHEAIALRDSHDSTDIVYLDNLKWQLDQIEPLLLPDGSERTWEDIAVDYLTEIKKIVENYTEIVAIVKYIVVTQPSRFHPLLTSALKNVYRKAQLMPFPVATGEQVHHLLAESWPSLVPCLPLKQIEKFQEDTVGYPVFGENFTGKHALITYDVGGGSTDISLFLVEIENYANMQIREIATDGTTGQEDYFFGNGFSALLFKHLWPSCQLWLERHAYDPEQFPIALPWDPIRLGQTQTIARKNGQRCVSFILDYLQGKEGPFEKINLALRNAGHWDDKTNEELLNIILEIQETFDQYLTQAQATLSLKSLIDKEVNIPAGHHEQGDGLWFDFAAFINDFIDNCSQPMFERLQRFLTHAELRDLKVYLITTGRGQFFPLVGSMLWAHIERFRQGQNKEIPKIEQVRVDPAFAKTIVCQGACYLAQLPKMSRGIVFVPRRLPSLGIQGDLDPDTGEPQFIPLCTGFPTPADDWQVVNYPLFPGFQQVSLTLYLSTHNKDVLSEDDKRLAELVDFVELTADEAKHTHIMIKAKTEDCLEIFLGMPIEAEISQKNYADWKRHLLGHYEIKPGACEPLGNEE